MWTFMPKLTAMSVGWRSEDDQLVFADIDWKLEVRKILIGVVDSTAAEGLQAQVRILYRSL